MYSHCAFSVEVQKWLSPRPAHRQEMIDDLGTITDPDPDETQPAMESTPPKSGRKTMSPEGRWRTPPEVLESDGAGGRRH